MRSKGDMCSSSEHFWSSTAPTQCRTIEPAPGGIISLCETCAQLGQRAESAQWRKCVCNLPGNCCNITNCAAEGQPGLTAPDYQMLWGDGWDVGGEGPVRCKEGRELLACKGHGMDVMQADCGGQYYSSVRVAAWLIGVFDLWAFFCDRCAVTNGESRLTPSCWATPDLAVAAAAALAAAAVAGKPSAADATWTRRRAKGRRATPERAGRWCRHWSAGTLRREISVRI